MDFDPEVEKDGHEGSTDEDSNDDNDAGDNDLDSQMSADAEEDGDESRAMTTAKLPHFSGVPKSMQEVLYLLSCLKHTITCRVGGDEPSREDMQLYLIITRLMIHFPVADYENVDDRDYPAGVIVSASASKASIKIAKKITPLLTDLKTQLTQFGLLRADHFLQATYSPETEYLTVLKGGKVFAAFPPPLSFDLAVFQIQKLATIFVKRMPPKLSIAAALVGAAGSVDGPEKPFVLAQQTPPPPLDPMFLSCLQEYCLTQCSTIRKGTGVLAMPNMHLQHYCMLPPAQASPGFYTKIKFMDWNTQIAAERRFRRERDEASQKAIELRRIAEEKLSTSCMRSAVAQVFRSEEATDWFYDLTMQSTLAIMHGAGAKTNKASSSFTKLGGMLLFRLCQRHVIKEMDDVLDGRDGMKEALLLLLKQIFEQIPEDERLPIPQRFFKTSRFFENLRKDSLFLNGASKDPNLPKYMFCSFQGWVFNLIENLKTFHATGMDVEEIKPLFFHFIERKINNKIAKLDPRILKKIELDLWFDVAAVSVDVMRRYAKRNLEVSQQIALIINPNLHEVSKSFRKEIHGLHELHAQRERRRLLELRKNLDK